MKHLPLSHLHNKLDGKSAKNKKRKTLKCASKSAFYRTVCMQFMFMYHLDLELITSINKQDDICSIED